MTKGTEQKSPPSRTNPRSIDWVTHLEAARCVGLGEVAVLVQSVLAARVVAQVDAEVDVPNHDGLVALLPRAHLALRQHFVQQIQRARLVADRDELCEGRGGDKGGKRGGEVVSKR